MSQYDPYLPPEERPIELNPYEAPRADLSPRYAPQRIEEGGDLLEPFSVDAVMRRSWFVFKDRLGLCLGAVIGVGALNYLFQMPVMIGLIALQAQGADQMTIGILSNLNTLASVVFSLWLSLGQDRVLLNLARGQNATFGMVFGGGRYFLRMFLASIVLFLACGALGLVCAIPAIVAFVLAGSQQVNALYVVGGILAFIGLLVFFAFVIRLYLYPYMLIDTNCGALGALQGSFDLTRGHTLALVALMFLTFAVNLLGILMCFVGVIFTGPLSVLMWAVAYAQLVGNRPGHAKPKSYPDLEFLD